MTRKADTHIRVTEETWTQLNSKKGPGDSFDDVIVELLERDCDHEGDDQDPPATDAAEPGDASSLAD